MIAKQVYIEFRDGIPTGVDFAAAYYGAQFEGCKIIPVTTEDILSDKYCRMYNKHPFILSIDNMWHVFKYLNKDLPQIEVMPRHRHSKDPQRFDRQYKRELTISLILPHKKLLESFRGCYVKPLDYKRWTSYRIDGEQDKPFVDRLYEDHKGCHIVISNPIFGGLDCEWRVFVRNGIIADMRPYSGNPQRYKTPKGEFLRECMEMLVEEPCYEVGSNFVMDIGITSYGENVFIEPGDMWSIGNYGMEPHLYFTMLVERYKELFIDGE